MKKLLPVFILLFWAQINTYPQTVYELNVKRDIAIGIVSLGLGITPFFINNEPDNIPGKQNKNDINAFDRSLMFSYNKPLDYISDYGAYGVAALPIISLIPNIKDLNSVLTYGVMYGEALLLTYGTAFTLKNAVVRYRPYVYSDGVPAGKEKDYFNSFPSGSTSFAFLGATFLSTTFSREFPESEWKLPVIIGSYTLAAGVASMRILSGSHFLTDVFTGAIIGSFYGWIIPWLHQKKDNDRLTIAPTGNGIIVSLKF